MENQIKISINRIKNSLVFLSENALSTKIMLSMLDNYNNDSEIQVLKEIIDFCTLELEKLK